MPSPFGIDNGSNPITSADMPQFNPAAAQPLYTPPPSLWQRLGRGFQHALMPDLPGAQGLLSPEDLNGARSRGLLDMGLSLLGNSQGAPGQNAPGFLPALAGGLQAGRQGYEQGAMGTIQNRAQLEQLKAQQAQQASRAKLLERLKTQYPNFATMTPDAQRAAIQGIFGEMISNGEFDAAGKIASVIPSMTQQPKGTEAKWEDFGGYKALMTPDGKELQRVAKTPSPRDPNAPDSAEQQRLSRRMQSESRLTNAFNQDTKTWRELGQKIQNAVELLPAALEGNGAAQTNMLYSFVSAMDPNSAVREGEIGLVQSASGLRAQAMNLIQKAQGGSAIVPPEMLRQMGSLMSARLASTANYINERADYYSGLGRRYELENPEELFPHMKAPTTGGRPNGPASGDRIRQNRR